MVTFCWAIAMMQTPGRGNPSPGTSKKILLFHSTTYIRTPFINYQMASMEKRKQWLKATLWTLT